MARSGDKISAFSLAFPAVMAALALAVLYVACTVPTGIWGLAAAAGLGPFAVVASIGCRSGFLCWGCSSILAMLLLPNKFCAILYVILFGLYPMIKSIAERFGTGLKSYLIKVSFFNTSISLLFLAAGSLLFDTLPQVLEGKLLLIYLLGNLVFVVYDLGLTRLVAFYLIRIHRGARKGRR